MQSSFQLSSAIAGGAAVAALIDKLVEKGVLTREDARNIAGSAQKALLGSMDSTIAEAARIVSGIYEKFLDR